MFGASNRGICYDHVLLNMLEIISLLKRILHRIPLALTSFKMLSSSCHLSSCCTGSRLAHDLQHDYPKKKIDNRENPS